MAASTARQHKSLKKHDHRTIESIAPRWWPVIVGTMAATVVANLLSDRNMLSSIVFAVCNAGEAALIAGLIERFFGSPFNLDTLRPVLGLLAATIPVIPAC